MSGERGFRVRGSAELRRHVNAILVAESERRAVWIAELLNSRIKCSAVAQARLAVCRRLRETVVRWDEVRGPGTAWRHYRVVPEARAMVGRLVVEETAITWQRLSFPDIGYLLGCTHGTLVHAIKKAEKEAKETTAAGGCTAGPEYDHL